MTSAVCREWNLTKIIGYTSYAKKVTYQSGSPIFTIGEDAAFVYFVLEGQVDLELNF
jgi:CRP-like cAMP-binding protein